MDEKDLSELTERLKVQGLKGVLQATLDDPVLKDIFATNQKTVFTIYTVNDNDSDKKPKERLGELCSLELTRDGYRMHMIAISGNPIHLTVDDLIKEGRVFPKLTVDSYIDGLKQELQAYISSKR